MFEPGLNLSDIMFLVFSCFIAATYASSELGCQSCLHATEALIKQTPIRSRSNTRAGDKELALGDSLPTMCSGYVFSGLELASELADACKKEGFAKAGGAVESALLEGKGALDACSTVCEGIPESGRVPKQKAAAAAAKQAPSPKGGKSAPRKGSVDDPAYKEALKKKAKRDAARLKRNAKDSKAETLDEEDL